jgi:hypothetical protein
MASALGTDECWFKHATEALRPEQRVGDGAHDRSHGGDAMIMGSAQEERGAERACGPPVLEHAPTHGGAWCGSAAADRGGGAAPSSVHGACKSSEAPDLGRGGPVVAVDAASARSGAVHGAGESRQAMRSSSESGMHASTGVAGHPPAPTEGAVGRGNGRGPPQPAGEARGGAVTAPPMAGKLVKHLDGSIDELLGGMQMPLPVLVRCSVNGELQPGTQKVGVLGASCSL